MDKITQIYFIVHPQYEVNRYNSILEAIKKLNIQNYTISNKLLWSNDITASLRSTLCKSNYSMSLHNRYHPLSNGEISLFMNHMLYLNEIRSNYKDGLFIIFESDVLFEDNFNEKLETVLKLSQNIDWDIINLGKGGGHLPADSVILPELNLYKSKINRCAEGIIWNYSGICKFLDYVTDIDCPFDTKMDVFSEYEGKFNIYLAHPPLVYQGSMCGLFKSFLR